MEYWQAFVLGIVQGLTEFLPISSSAHLKVVPALFHWNDAGVSFDAVIQLGSIVAVVSYFWKDLSNITLGSIEAIRKKQYKSQEFKLAIAIALGTIPILFGGLLIKVFIKDYDNSPLRSLTAIAIASIVMSSLLALAEVFGQRGDQQEKRHFHRVRVIDGILMGLAQAMALVPGVSRSGSTLTAGLFLGLDRVAATRFSFLLGIPAITIAGLVELLSIVKKGFDVGAGQLAVGLISSVIFSYLAIAWLLKFFQTHTTWVFVGYRLVFGALLLTGVGLGWFK
ncbi:undecaprenyl-diphosphate phosphatase [Pseudanabaena yagii]|uniref:Undecaprenyl-diphosphatase n=1 Tax=Pseudanabaena yagii GIHE-NHR1 TaxID=2722753 RepID=A0ABX1LU90_9CYAN|nr:undecaprenyl-diphosphate phosphatase [Pseudanabaena yagii]NMF58601.1 undecaprenyl-diphosphate phosphatase [Pseudanabaena yagii GIHE-NHR1]